MSVVYDIGVLVAADRDDRRIWADHKARLALGLVPVVSAAVVAQASRSPRQVPLRRFLRGCRVAAFAAEHAHAVGALLAGSGTVDVVDGHVALFAGQDDALVLTGDLGDFRALAPHTRPRLRVRPP